MKIYEGFGSSYDKARSAIEAMRLHFPLRRLLVVFEPHTFSWRNRGALPWYDSVFKGVDDVIVYKPSRVAEDTTTSPSLEEMLARIRASGVSATGARAPEDVLGKLDSDLRGDDVLLLLSSGPMGGLIESVPKLAEKKFPL